MHETVGVQGHLVMEVTMPGGRLLSRTEATNTVVTGGLNLIAQLLAGQATAPVFASVTGLSADPTDLVMVAMKESDGVAPVPASLESSAGGLTLKSVFPKATQSRIVKEAGLMLTCQVNGQPVSTLYNRVLVQPSVSVPVDAELTLTWTLTFRPKAS